MWKTGWIEAQLGPMSVLTIETVAGACGMGLVPIVRTATWSEGSRQSGVARTPHGVQADTRARREAKPPPPGPGSGGPEYSTATTKGPNWSTSIPGRPSASPTHSRTQSVSPACFATCAIQQEAT